MLKRNKSGTKVLYPNHEKKLVLLSLGCVQFTKKVAHSKLKSQKCENAKFLVKLSYSAEKLQFQIILFPHKLCVTAKRTCLNILKFLSIF